MGCISCSRFASPPEWMGWRFSLLPEEGHECPESRVSSSLCSLWPERSSELPKDGKPSGAVTTPFCAASKAECLERAASLAMPFGGPLLDPYWCFPRWQDTSKQGEASVQWPWNKDWFKLALDIEADVSGWKWLSERVYKHVVCLFWGSRRRDPVSEEEVASQERRNLFNGGLAQLWYENYDCTKCVVAFYGLLAQCNFLNIKI